MELQSATFAFENKGEIILATCDPIIKVWTVVTNTKGKIGETVEERSHQFVNQTRAKEIILQFYNSKK